MASSEIPQLRQQLSDALQRAARAEGEVVALRQALDLLASVKDLAAAKATVTELTAKLAAKDDELRSCLIRAQTQPVSPSWPLPNAGGGRG